MREASILRGGFANRASVRDFLTTAAITRRLFVAADEASRKSCID